MVLVTIATPLTQHAGAHNGGGGGGGAGESGTATHQHLDSRFSHNRYYYDRGYAVHTPPAGGVANLTGRNGERYCFQGGNWYRWRGEWYRSWGGAWVVVDAPLGLFVPALPPYYTTIWWGETPYYYANDTYYLRDAEQNNYEVVGPPDRLKAATATRAAAADGPYRHSPSSLRGGPGSYKDRRNSISAS